MLGRMRISYAHLDAGEGGGRTGGSVGAGGRGGMQAAHPGCHRRGWQIKAAILVRRHVSLRRSTNAAKTCAASYSREYPGCAVSRIPNRPVQICSTIVAASGARQAPRRAPLALERALADVGVEDLAHAARRVAVRLSDMGAIQGAGMAYAGYKYMNLPQQNVHRLAVKLL